MLLIFGALKIELRSIIRSTRISKKIRIGRTRLYKGRSGDGDIMIVVTGMGRNNAARAAETALRQQEVPKDERLKVLITGFCGACREGLKAGDLVVYKSVMDLAGSGLIKGCENKKMPARHDLQDNITAGLSVKGIRPVTCGCTDHVVSSPEEKKRLFSEYGTEVVDMETCWLIDSLIKNGLSPDRIHCIRAVSDGAGDMLPSYMECARPKKLFTGICVSAIRSVCLPPELKSNIDAFKNIRKAGCALAHIPDLLTVHPDLCG
jgi:nucleoside phosphorylase